MTVSTYVQTPEGRLELVDAVASGLRLAAPQGGIELRVGETALLSSDLVDNLGDLWGYLLNGLEAVAAGDAFETFYPSYPVPIAFAETEPRRHVRHVRVRAGDAAAVVSWPDLFAGIAGGARTYARAMQTLDAPRGVDHARMEQRAQALAAAGLDAHASRGRS